MITQMTRYSFILLSGEQEGFLSKLQELGVVDITRSEKPMDDQSAALLARSEDLVKAQKMLDSIDYSEDPSLEKIQATKFPPVKDIAAETFSTTSELASLTSRLEASVKEREARLPWGDFDSVKIDTLEEHGYIVRYYKVAAKAFKEEWKELQPLQVVKEDGKNVWFVTISDDPRYSFPVPETKDPGESYKSIDEDINDLSSRIISCKGKLMHLKGCSEEIAEQSNATLSQLDLYLAGQASDKAAEGHISVFEGFAPIEEDERLAGEFDKMDVLWFKEAAKVEDNPPIALKSNWFTKMFTVLTDMYGRPEYNGFDPTPFISVFFLLFFAFCMGDAGYGLVLVVVGLLLKKVKSFSDLSPLVTTLGLGTIVIGLLFHTFFSIDIMGWFPESVQRFMVPSKVMGYDGTMVLAIAVGIFHLCIAMVVKTYNVTKQKGFANSLGTWGWTLLIVGGVIVGGIALTGVMDKTVTKWVIIILGIVSAAGIFLLNDLHRNPLLNIGSGLWETYNTVTGLLGDVLSYLRLYALGLAGMMLGQAFNSLGLMALGDGAILNWVFFILIVIIGHTLNLAMAALGAFVHPLRLNFLEFFKNSGYEISGRNYNPLGGNKE